MKWYVDQYADRIKPSDKPENALLYGSGYDTEAEAKAYIIDRAKRAVVRAEKDLRNQKAQLAKAIKKFGGAQ